MSDSTTNPSAVPADDFDVRSIPTRGPGARSWLAMLEIEWKLISRDSAGMVIPLLLPLLIMVMSGVGGAEVIPGTGGRTAMELYVLPMVLVMVVTTIGVINVPSAIAVYRKEGILRRLGVTPASPGMVLTAHLAVNLVHTLIGVAIATTVAGVAFDASLPERPAVALGMFALTCAAMFAIGMVLAAVAPSTNFALAAGLISFFGLMAVGGGFGTRESFPAWLDTIGAYTPFGAGMDTLRATWGGELPPIEQVGVLGGVAVIATLAALRLFRWT